MINVKAALLDSHVALDRSCNLVCAHVWVRWLPLAIRDQTQDLVHEIQMPKPRFVENAKGSLYVVWWPKQIKRKLM